VIFSKSVEGNTICADRWRFGESTRLSKPE
jgi:hypothetical protein